MTSKQHIKGFPSRYTGKIEIQSWNYRGIIVGLVVQTNGTLLHKFVKKTWSYNIEKYIFGYDSEGRRRQPP